MDEESCCLGRQKDFRRKTFTQAALSLLRRRYSTKSSSLVICSYFLKKSVVKDRAKCICSEQHSISMSDDTSVEGHSLSLGVVLLISQSRCLISAVSWMLGNHTQNTPEHPPRLCNKSCPPRQQEETLYVPLGEDFRSLSPIVMHLCSSGSRVTMEMMPSASLVILPVLGSQHLSARAVNFKTQPRADWPGHR